MRKGPRDKCWYCGQEEKCTADHFYPKSLGGRKKVPACKLCQSTKGSMMPDEWAKYMRDHVAIRGEIAVRIDTAVRTTMEHTKDEYLKVKRRIHNEQFERFKI